jgi:menaquinol-cytochrome c reductase iron-sulfur subunit
MAKLPKRARGGYSDEGLPPSAGLSRRGIITDLIAATIGVLLGAPLIGYLTSSRRRQTAAGRWVPVGPVSVFPAGSRNEVEYSYTKQDAWLASVSRRRVIVSADAPAAGRYTVFSSACTHLGCGVRWDRARNQFLCPCHGGVYDSDGRPVAGPVPRPLDRLKARVSPDGQLEVLEA